MKILGIILIILGVVAFIYTGYTYTTKETVADLGPIEIKADRERTLSWPPIVGVIMVLGGVILIVTDKKR